MRIRYFLADEPAPLLEDTTAECVPRVGEMVYIRGTEYQDIFFVEKVVYYPPHNDVRVYLIEELPHKVKVAENKQPIVKLEQVSEVKKIADQALKESSSLKRQMLSVNDQLNYIRNKIGKNEPR